jgi:hypothetical protein
MGSCAEEFRVVLTICNINKTPDRIRMCRYVRNVHRNERRLGILSIALIGVTSAPREVSYGTETHRDSEAENQYINEKLEGCNRYWHRMHHNRQAVIL